jgi:predicted dehydrogenase
MSYDRLRVAMIGTGRISDLHAIEYCRNPHAEIVALCDRDTETAKSRAAAWGVGNAKIVDDYRAIFADPDIDLVEILLPHHLHRPVALAAIEAGKAVSLQKPMCLDLAEADQLVEAAAHARAPVKVFENFIFYPPVMKARALVDEGAIGTPLTIRIKSNPGRSETAWNVPHAADAWRQERSQSGGGPLVFDDGHHKFALAWHFMGNPEEVHAFIGETERPDGFYFDAPAIVSFRFPGNRMGNLEVVYSPELDIITRHYAQDDRVEITGSKGVIWINCGHGRLGDPPPLALYRDGELRTFHNMETGWEASFVHSTRHFIEALRNGTAPSLTAAEGRQVLRFALAAEESARTGKTVEIG